MARFLASGILIAVSLAVDAGIRPASAAALLVAAQPPPVVDTFICPLPAVPPLIPTVLPCL